MRYVLKNEGYATFKYIYKARQRVGRVFKHADGYYVGMIGPTTRKASTERAAFDAVVSADLGYEDVEALNAHNRAVRSENKRRRAQANAELMRDPMFRDIMESIAKVAKAVRG